MLKQINLYEEILLQRKSRQIIDRLPLAIVILIGVLFSVSLYMIWNNNQLQLQITQHQEKLSHTEHVVKELLAKIPAQALDQNLVLEVQRWQQNIQNLKHTMQVLNSKNADNSQGFSPFFQALANQAFPEVWVTHIAITWHPKTIKIDGSSYEAGKIPKLIQNLQNEPVFSGQSFAKLSINPVENDTGQLNFELNSTQTLTETNSNVH